MKKYLSFALVLVLTAALFTGCGCTRRDAQYTTVPTTMPTITTTAPTTETTHPTTEHTSEPTIDHGNGPLDNTTESTAGTEATDGNLEGRARRMDPAMN